MVTPLQGLTPAPWWHGTGTGTRDSPVLPRQSCGLPGAPGQRGQRRAGCRPALRSGGAGDTTPGLSPVPPAPVQAVGRSQRGTDGGAQAAGCRWRGAGSGVRAVGRRQLGKGSRAQAMGCRQQGAGVRAQAVGWRQRGEGNGAQAAGCRQRAARCAAPELLRAAEKRSPDFAFTHPFEMCSATQFKLHECVNCCKWNS